MKLYVACLRLPGRGWGWRGRVGDGHETAKESLSVEVGQPLHLLLCLLELVVEVPLIILQLRHLVPPTGKPSPFLTHHDMHIN